MSAVRVLGTFLRKPSAVQIPWLRAAGVGRKLK